MTTKTAPSKPFANARHHAGCLWWVDLTTPDVAAAKRFYGELLDWTFEDVPMGDGRVYSMARLDEFDAAAINDQPAEQQGMPPYWTSYVSVDDVDATTARVAGLGGSVVAEPFDVMDTVGRMSVIQDPTGATAVLWQAGTHPGAQVTSQPGAYSWSELMVNGDVAEAERFWTSLMGWTTDKQPMPQGGEYTTFMHDGHPACGMIAMPTEAPDAAPSAWMVYFAVADVDASIAKIAELGGTVHMGPLPAPGVGSWAMASDPQGGHFYVLQLDEWPS